MSRGWIFILASLSVVWGIAIRVRSSRRAQIRRPLAVNTRLVAGLSRIYGTRRRFEIRALPRPPRRSSRRSNARRTDSGHLRLSDHMLAK